MTPYGRHAILSNRLAVDFTFSGTEVRCAWDPALPARLTDSEHSRYVRARDAFMSEVARRLRGNVLLGDVTREGVSRVLCFHPDGRIEVVGHDA